jgi:hypothetical protein
VRSREVDDFCFEHIPPSQENKERASILYFCVRGRDSASLFFFLFRFVSLRFTSLRSRWKGQRLVMFFHQCACPQQQTKNRRECPRRCCSTPLRSLSFSLPSLFFFFLFLFRSVLGEKASLLCSFNRPLRLPVLPPTTPHSLVAHLCGVSCTLFPDPSYLKALPSPPFPNRQY